MGREARSRGARGARSVAGVAAALFAAAALAGCGSSAARADNNLTVSVRGNHLVNASGNRIRLLGVDRSGTEYACSGGRGFTDSPSPGVPDSRSMIDAIRSWGANAVRVPLNEACWLGINAVKPRWGGANYRDAVATYVHRLEAAGIRPILDLHVVDPGNFAANHGVNDGLRPMPDAAHAIPFWRGVARRYGHDRAVVFDLYNEPNDVDWPCLRDGCWITDDSYDPTVPDYRAVGTQRLVDVIRRQGAGNVIMVPGIDWTSDLSQWLRYRPHDPLRRIAASLHTYQAPLGDCYLPCWRGTVAPVARRFPVVTGEFGDVDCRHSYIDSYMRWADAHGISYLGWEWDATSGAASCRRGPALIRDYDGTPTGYGVGLRDHLRALRARG